MTEPTDFGQLDQNVKNLAAALLTTVVANIHAIRTKLAQSPDLARLTQRQPGLVAVLDQTLAHLHAALVGARELLEALRDQTPWWREVPAVWEVPELEEPDAGRIDPDITLDTAGDNIRLARTRLEQLPGLVRRPPWASDTWWRSINHLSSAWRGVQELLTALRMEGTSDDDPS